MRRITVLLPEALYQELQDVASTTHEAGESGISADDWVCELVQSDLAARRLPKVAPGAYGARVNTAPEPETVFQRFRVVPEAEWGI